jgi:hypothetical protein
MDRTNIITEGWPKDNEILLDEISCKYIQEPDCTEDRDGDPQEITLSSRDGGGGKFIHIKTNGWSICGDDFEMDLIPLIKDFKWRMDEVFDNSGFAREKVLENSNS